MKTTFLLIAFAFTLSGITQTTTHKLNQHHFQAIIQGLGEESAAFAYSNPVRLNTIEVEPGKKLQYAEKGNPAGTPVILLHGLSDSWHSFEKILPLLPEDIHAFALTQRGHGVSDKTFKSYTPKDFARDVATFIKMKGLKNVIVVGHSMGGVVAQQFALGYPELLQALVIIGSSPSFHDNPGLPELHREALALGATMDKAFMDAFQKSTLVKPIDAVYYDTIVAEGMKIPTHVFKAALTGIMNVDFTTQLKQVQKPVLIVWGSKDEICPRTDQDEMVKQIPNAKLLVYQNTGHALHWEEPQRFATDLLRFIQTEAPKL